MSQHQKLSLRKAAEANNNHNPHKKLKESASYRKLLPQSTTHRSTADAPQELLLFCKKSKIESEI